MEESELSELVEISEAVYEKPDGSPGKSVSVNIKSIGEDSAELYHSPGSFSMPIDGTIGVSINVFGRNIIVATDNYNIEIDIEKGEHLVYSTDAAGAIKSKILLNKDGEIIFNDGTKSSVSHEELGTALQSMVTAINTALGTKKDEAGTAGSISLDISGSEVDKVLLP